MGGGNVVGEVMDCEVGVFGREAVWADMEVEFGCKRRRVDQFEGAVWVFGLPVVSHVFGGSPGMLMCVGRVSFVRRTS